MGIEGNLSTEEILSIYEKLNITTNKPVVLVETGTYQGDSIEAVHTLFDNMYTIELDETRYMKAKTRLKALEHIGFFCGNSLDVLPGIVNECRTKYCVWFLDAHSCGDVKVPLLEEIEIILKGVDRDVPLLFILDDVRLFDKHWDWSGVSIPVISSLVSKTRILSDLFVYKDRLIVHVK
jgi:hypothetical protein